MFDIFNNMGLPTPPQPEAFKQLMEHKAVFKDYLTTEDGNVTDSIVDSVRNKLHQRSLLGISKYGVTLNRTDLSELDWLRHAQEEMLDGANYLEVLIQAKEKQIASSNRM